MPNDMVAWKELDDVEKRFEQNHIERIDARPL